MAAFSRDFGIVSSACSHLPLPATQGVILFRTGEAGELCMLATSSAPTRHVVFPNRTPQTELQPLEDIAARFLRAHGYEAEFVESENERAAVWRLQRHVVAGPSC